MELLTKDIEEKFRKHPLGSQDGIGENAEVLVKYFNPTGIGTWLITEADHIGDDWIMYGFCHLHEWEWGEVSLNELKNLNLPFGMKIERDLYVGNKKQIKDFIDLKEKDLEL